MSNLDIVYLPPYEREIRYYQKVNIEQIKRAIKEIDWEKAFFNTDFDKMGYIFNRLLNVLCNFITHEKNKIT